MQVPMIDLSAELKPIRGEIDAAIAKILDSGHFILGENVDSFEQEASQYLGVKYAVSLNSGTDALIIGLRSLGVNAGDEVIVPPFTFFATAEAVSLIGAVPVFADIDPITFNLNPCEVKKKLNRKTKAIIPVHLFGQSAQMSELTEIAKSSGLCILEDAAQAFGADNKGKKVGSLGDAAAFSFFPTKNLGAFGDGGMLTTNDKKIADLSRMLRVHGSYKRYHHDAFGYASRLDEIQAAVLRVKLPKIDLTNQKRREAASRYDEILKNIPGIITPHIADGNTHIFHQYTIRVIDGHRDEMHAKLAQKNISSMIYYPIAIHKLKAYQSSEHLPEAEKAAREVLSLPLWPDIPIPMQLHVGETIKEILKSWY